MVDYIPINLKLHKSDLIALNEEYMSWIIDEMQQQYNSFWILNIDYNSFLCRV